MKDLDIIYEIFDGQLYLEPEILKRKVSEIRDISLATGLLVDLACKSYTYHISDQEPIVRIITEDYNVLDPYESHVEYITALRNDPRCPLRNFLFEFDGDLAENADFLLWVKSLKEKDISIVEKYCIDNEYYEVIDFILKNR